MTAIIRDEVEPLPRALPAPVRWTIELCLLKDPDQRYDSTRDLCRQLRQTRDGLSQTLGLPAATVAAAPRARLRWAWAAAVNAVALSGLVGGWFQSLRHIATPPWAGVRLGGPVVALAPRMSPDGQMLALLTLVDGQTQVAIMKPDGGSWNVLTHDRTNGSATNVGWARDGSRLFFDRFGNGPPGSIRFSRASSASLIFRPSPRPLEAPLTAQLRLSEAEADGTCEDQRNRAGEAVLAPLNLGTGDHLLRDSISDILMW